MSSTAGSITAIRLQSGGAIPCRSSSNDSIVRSNPARNATTGVRASTAAARLPAIWASARSGASPEARTRSSVMPWTREAPGGIGTPGSISHVSPVHAAGASPGPTGSTVTSAACTILSASQTTPVVSVSKPKRGPSYHFSLMATP
ncbi:hypothetical protein GCM10028833_33200 [Glycomyces tarimensis]